MLNKNIRFNRNEAEWKMENPRHAFRETNLVLIQELWIKSKTVMSRSSWKKKECSFCNIYFVFLTFISMYSVLNKLLKCICFYISKNVTLYTFFCLFLKSSKAISLSPRRELTMFSIHSGQTVNECVTLDKAIFLMKLFRTEKSCSVGYWSLKK